MNELLSTPSRIPNRTGPGKRTIKNPSSGWITKIARRAVFLRLNRIAHGVIIVIEGPDRHFFGQISNDGDLQVVIEVRDPRCYIDVAFSGTIGAGESYGRGDWECDDLTTLVRLFALNRTLLAGMERGMARLCMPGLKAIHRWHRNTRSGSRDNIAAHYDLSNEFFALMLDQTMMYSCAYFQREGSTLAEASNAKNDLICRKLSLLPEDHVLEIGTGWGGFALYAARQYGCRVTTATISQAQYEWATDRINAEGLSDRVTVLLRDYRDLPQLQTRFDKLVSIEMIEAVGHEYYRAFFDVCGRMLKPNGLMLVQAIIIEERRYEQAKQSVDFIQRFIFPGSCIPSVSSLCHAMARASDLSVIQLQDIGAHYPPTLRAWRRNVQENIQQIRRLGFRNEFLRLWDFYLCYCEGGFLERSISTVHLLFAKPAWRQAIRC